MLQYGRPVLAAAVLYLAGCSLNPPHDDMPASLRAGDARPDIVMTSKKKVGVSAMFRRVIPKDSRWSYVGSIAAGDVYQGVNTVFTVEGVDIHEAYLVISGRDLVGYYLPFEKTFEELGSPEPLAFVPK